MPAKQLSPNFRKPKGSVHQRTIFLRALKAKGKTESGFAEELIEQALAGNRVAIDVVTTRLWRKPKPTQDPIKLPEADTPAEVAELVIRGMANGTIPPDVAVTMVQALRTAAEVTDIQEILTRLEQLEAA